MAAAATEAAAVSSEALVILADLGIPAGTTKLTHRRVVDMLEYFANDLTRLEVIKHVPASEELDPSQMLQDLFRILSENFEHPRFVKNLELFVLTYTSARFYSFMATKDALFPKPTLPNWDVPRAQLVTAYNFMFSSEKLLNSFTSQFRLDQY